MRLPRRSLLLAAIAAVLAPATAEANPVVSRPDAQTLLVRSTADEVNVIATQRVGDDVVITESGAADLDAGPSKAAATMSTSARAPCGRTAR